MIDDGETRYVLVWKKTYSAHAVKPSEKALIIDIWNWNCFWRSSFMEASKCKMQNSWKFILLHLKNSKENTDIHVGIIHKCVNFQDEICWDKGCAKKSRLFNTWYYSFSQIINLFFVQVATALYFILKVYTHTPYILVYLYTFFFWIFQDPKRHSICIHYIVK